jgi:hypothetical protein
MLELMSRRKPARPALLSERGQGLAVLLLALAGLFALVVLANGHP